MLLLPITFIAASLAIFTTPLGRIFRQDYQVRNSFVEDMIQDLG